MRPISLIVVHRWPSVVSILTSPGSLVQCAGRIKNSGITWNPIKKSALAWEIAQIRARNPLLCFSNSFHSTFPKPVSNEAGPDSR